MVAFRKMLPVLALVGTAFGLASTASAQTTPLTCTANAGVPPLVRAEGYTELVGDVVLICTGGANVAPFQANFQLFLNTNITSRLLSGGASEATLLVDEPGQGSVTPGVNSFTAATTSQPNSVVWPGVTVVPPGTTGTRTFRFTNLRANAAGLGTSNTLIPTQIVAFLSVSGSQALAINNPQQTVAYIQQGLQFAIRSCSGGDLNGTNAFAQCTNFGGGLRTDPSGSAEGQFALRFREGFQTAFKPRMAAGQDNSLPGTNYNSESGFVQGDVLGGAGVASNGTRLAARFANIPAGVRLYATVAGVAQSGNNASAILVNADPNGAGGAILAGSGAPLTGITPTATLQCGGTAAVTIPASTGANAVEIPVVNGTAVAVWEVTASDPSRTEDVLVLIGVAGTANTANNLPGLGTATVTGNFAPFYAASAGANVASSALPIPRFVDNPLSANAFTISSCQTNLLFPFVTAASGFDTGIAISNTSRDPFSGNAGRVQGGTCTLNFYGAGANGGAAPAAVTTTGNVEAGQQLLYVLSTGGNLGLTQNAAGFTGYIIAQCNFRYAHGFAFITDGPIGQAKVAEGYLALVMDSGISTRTGASSEVLVH